MTATPTPLAEGAVVELKVASTKAAPESQLTNYYVDKIVTLECVGNNSWVCWCSGLQCPRLAKACRHIYAAKGARNEVNDGDARYRKATVSGADDEATFQLKVSAWAVRALLCV
jgi:hypothetical protein